MQFNGPEAAPREREENTHVHQTDAHSRALTYAADGVRGFTISLDDGIFA